MANKAVFYLLSETTPKARDLCACRLAEKAYLNQRKVYIHTNSLEETKNLDTQLWTFRDISFVPHDIYEVNLQSESPVLIGHYTAPSEHNDVLINLTQEVPAFYHQFNHIIELVVNDEDFKVSARQRYQFYQAQGLTLEKFEL